MGETIYSVAEAKKRFSEILGRVAYARERIIISKHGKPLAMVIPPDQALREERLNKIHGWLDEDDPFFQIIDDIVADRPKHLPRVLRPQRKTGKDVSAAHRHPKRAG